MLCAILAPSSQRKYSGAGKGFKKGNLKDKQEYVITSVPMKTEQAEILSFENRRLRRIR